MNSTVKDVIKQCSKDSYEGLLSFPEVLGRLINVGVESYSADYRNQSTTYYFSNNEAITISMKFPGLVISKEFNKEGVVLAIRSAQSHMLKYPEFINLTMSAGCVGYMVWITGRHVSYFGRQGEILIEHFPSQG